MENIEEQIKNVIHKLRPYLQRDGGDIEYVDFKDGIVYVQCLMQLLKMVLNKS